MPAPRQAPPPFEMPSFGTIAEEPPADAEEPPIWKRPKMLAIAAALVAVVAGGWYFSRSSLGAAPAVPATGTLVLTTNPAGARAIVDGEAARRHAADAVAVARLAHRGADGRGHAAGRFP